MTVDELSSFTVDELRVRLVQADADVDAAGADDYAWAVQARAEVRAALRAAEQVEPGDLVIQLVDGVPHVHTQPGVGQ